MTKFVQVDRQPQTIGTLIRTDPAQRRRMWCEHTFDFLEWYHRRAIHERGVEAFMDYAYAEPGRDLAYTSAHIFSHIGLMGEIQARVEFQTREGTVCVMLTFEDWRALQDEFEQFPNYWQASPAYLKKKSGKLQAGY